MRFALGPYADAVEARLQRLAADGAADRIRRRDASLWSDDVAIQALISARLGWIDISSRMRANVAELQQFADSVRSAGFRDAVLLGMGGSSLAPEVMRRSLPRDETCPSLHVLDTTDPETIERVRREIDVTKTVFFVSSKSGTTIEPLSLFAYFHREVASAQAVAAGDNFVAITDEGAPLQQLAAEHGFRHVFTNPSDIGGRYSALSYFGLVPAAVAGVNVARLVEQGASAEGAIAEDGGDAMRLGAVLGTLAQLGRDKCTFIITPVLGTLGLWLEQLIAESTGKEGHGILPVVGEPLGTPLKYGDDRVFVQITIDGGEGANQDSLAGALQNEGFPIIVIDLDGPYDLGAEFVRWEYATAIAGHVLGINPFDEPNVRESKDNTARVLAELETTGLLGGRDAPPADHIVRPDSFAHDLHGFIGALKPGAYVAITAYIAQSDEADAAFAGLRTTMRDALGVATTVGYGPRYLHSTGQFHKGGPPEGSFLQITAADDGDLPVPGAAYSFGELKRAQAIGDYQSLTAHGRPALRYDLGSDVPGSLVRLQAAVDAAVTSRAGRR